MFKDEIQQLVTQERTCWKTAVSERTKT